MSTPNLRIKETRKYLKISQQQFASKLGVSRAHVSNMENGNDNPSLSLLKLICIKFGVSEEWLINGNGPQFPNVDTETRDGLMAKYNGMRLFLEAFIEQRTGDDLKNTVEAYSFFAGLLAAHELTDDNQSQYLKSFCMAIDEFERLQYRIMTMGNIYNKKTDDRHWDELISGSNKSIETINCHLKDALNVYLNKYGKRLDV